MIKAIVFDVGGVVFTATPNPEKELRFAADAIKLLGAHGIAIPDTPAEFAKKLAARDKQRKADNQTSLCEFPPMHVWSAYYLKDYAFTDEQLFPIAEELCFRWNADRNDIVFRDGLSDALEQLYRQGMRLGIISNTVSRTHVPYELHRANVSRYFEFVLLSSVCGIRKPDPAVFQLCETAMHMDKSEMAYVGDTFSRDVIGVKRAGWAWMVLIKNDRERPGVHEREQALAASGYLPDARIDELTELPAVIASYNQLHP